MSDEIDMDAIEILGINPKVWKEFRGMTNWKEERGTQYREKPLERELPPKRLEPHPRFVQDEMESIVAQIDEREAEIRRKQALAQRWFWYYRKCKDKKKKLNLIDQYNYLAKQR